MNALCSHVPAAAQFILLDTMSESPVYNARSKDDQPPCQVPWVFSETPLEINHEAKTRCEGEICNALIMSMSATCSAAESLVVRTAAMRSLLNKAGH